MKILKTLGGKACILIVVACLAGPLFAKPESLLDAVHANHVSHDQKKLMKQMMKLHKSLKSLDPMSVDDSLHTRKKNEYLKQFRKKKRVKK